MKGLFEGLGAWLRKQKNKLVIAATLLFTIITVIVLFKYFCQFSSYAAMMLAADIAVLKLYLVDKYLLTGYNTMEELKNGNIAVSLALVAYAILVLGALIAAFIVIH